MHFQSYKDKELVWFIHPHNVLVHNLHVKLFENRFVQWDEALLLNEFFWIFFKYKVLFLCVGVLSAP